MCADGRVQMINGSDYQAKCENCYQKLLRLGNFMCTNNRSTTDQSVIEHCICKKCGASFSIEYPIFEENGHLMNYVYAL